jgi:hypothetical protein
LGAGNGAGLAATDLGGAGFVEEAPGWAGFVEFSPVVSVISPTVVSGS